MSSTNWKSLIRALATSTALVTPAFPLAAVEPQNPLEAMPPALRMPQADEVTARLVWQAVANQFPEVVNGPERDGTFIIAIALRPDGTVVRSGLRYAASAAEVNSDQQALHVLLPSGGMSTPLGFGPQARGTVVLAGRTLKARTAIAYTIMPANWEEARDVALIRRAVIEKHVDLFLPMSADHINQLTVSMNENGGIAHERVEMLAVEHHENMSRVVGGCQIPEIAGAFTALHLDANAAAAGFADLGLELDHVGLMGMLQLTLPGSGRSPAPLPTVGADGISRGAMMVFDPPVLQVCYAWPRRPGEPVGGTVLAQDSLPRNDASSSNAEYEIGRLAERYFPPDGPRGGNWMLLTFNGKVVRTGNVELGKDERLTQTYVERLIPGIKIAGSSGMEYFSAPKRPGDSYGPQIHVDVYFLSKDSPLPPPEDMPAVADQPRRDSSKEEP